MDNILPSVLSIIESADRSLQEKSIAGINRKYEGVLHERALEQLRKELEIVKKQGSAPGYLAVWEVLNAVDAKPEEYSLKGTGGSSLLVYALGLSDIEPITSSPALYPEFYFGLNGEKMPCFELNVTGELKIRILEYYKKNDIEPVHLCFDTRVYEELSAEPTKNEKIINEYCAPVTYEEQVKCYGLAHGIGTWEGNAELLLKNKKVPFDEIIGTVEDIYEYLAGHGLDIRMAYEITEYVRKGKIHSFGWGKGMIEALFEADIPVSYMESCEKIQYLIPRYLAMKGVAGMNARQKGLNHEYI